MNKQSLIFSQKSAIDARKRCQEFDWELAVIQSKGEEDFLLSEIQENDEIGVGWLLIVGTHKNSDRKWYRSHDDNVEANYQINWSAGEPTDSDGENCVGINKQLQKSTMMAMKCDTSKAYICSQKNLFVHRNKN